ncbi:MAG: SIMPL domain-containing protein [Cyclobacteriaceae bacterium]
MRSGLFVIIVLLLQSVSVWSQNKNFIDQPYIETSAQVDTLVVPDRIFLNIVIKEKDTKGKISVEELEAKMEKVLNGLGINTKENLMLNDLGSNFRKYFLKSQDIEKSKAYTLMVENAVMAGSVMLELEKIEISNVLLGKTEYSKMDELKLNMKSKAIRKAKKQALSMAEPLNQIVGPAIHISDRSDQWADRELAGRTPGIQIRGYSAARPEKFKPADIEFEKIKVVSKVDVKFKLED